MRSYFPMLHPVHPHVHGELFHLFNLCRLCYGSSPRAWGTLKAIEPDVIQLRFIPTCMGNSAPCRSGPRALPVHPHVHGELFPSGASVSFAHGSSPRAWGTLSAPCRERFRRRFIPTCMGNSQVVLISESYRFIPTCMGNSFSPAHERGMLAVHPHVHGELSSTITYLPTRIGSSPRAWGTLQNRFNIHLNSRFIPTCMGNSRRLRTRKMSMSVHPHVHGELLKGFSR